MQNLNSRILQKNRLRPQKRGKLPNFTKDFENYESKIRQVIENKVQFSFQINKFGIQKSDIIFNRKRNAPFSENVYHINMNNSLISTGSNVNGCEKYLKYNETKIRPDHKIKLHKKSPQKVKTQNSELSMRQMKKQQDLESTRMNSLPKINLTSRQVTKQKCCLFNKENQYDSRTARLPLHQSYEKNKNYIRLYHIVTMGRKQILN